MAILSWQLTDEQYIARVRRFQRWRRVLGVFLLLFGVGFAALFNWLFWSTWENVSEPLFSRDEEKSVESANHDDNESDHRIPVDDAFEMADSSRRMGMVLGLVLGSGRGAAALCFLELAGQGLGMLLFRDRKTELLLRCLDGGPEAVSGSRDERSAA